jgi:hypothetical protein
MKCRICRSIYAHDGCSSYLCHGYHTYSIVTSQHGSFLHTACLRFETTTILERKKSVAQRHRSAIYSSCVFQLPGYRCHLARRPPIHTWLSSLRLVHLHVEDSRFCPDGNPGTRLGYTLPGDTSLILGFRKLSRLAPSSLLVSCGGMPRGGFHGGEPPVTMDFDPPVK